METEKTKENQWGGLVEAVRRETPLHKPDARSPFLEPDLPIAKVLKHWRVAEQVQPVPDAVRTATLSVDASDRIKQLLTILWSDCDFWARVSKGHFFIDLFFYVQLKYRLSVPLMPSEDWKRMASERHLRDRVFDIMSKQHWRLIPLGRILGEGEEEKMVALFKEVLDSGAFDNKALIATKELPIVVLELLRETAQGLASDIDWVLKNPGQARPQVVRNEPGRPPTLEHARRLEAMIGLLRVSPSSSDRQIAQHYLKKNDPQTWKMIHDREATGKSLKDPLQTLRKDAGEARQLAQLRDGVKVAHYVNDQGKAKNPCRKNPVGN